MVTYEAIYREGKRYGIGDHQIAKINMAREQSVEGLTYAYRPAARSARARTCSATCRRSARWSSS